LVDNILNHGIEELIKNESKDANAVF
jgi:hypothetical protein